MSRTRRSAWSLSTGLLFTLISLGVGVFSTPWLLHWLGQERFGAYRVLLDWGGYIALCEFGLSGALMARLAVAVGKGEADATRGLVAAGLRLYVRVTLLMMAVGLLWIAGLPHLVSTETVSTRELRTAGLVMVAGLALTPLMVFRWVAEARQRGYLISLLLTGQSGLTTALLITAAWSGLGLVGQSLATVIAQCLFPLILLWDGLRAYPGVISERSLPATRNEVWSLNWPTFIFNLSGRVGLLADNIIISWGLGLAAVAPFILTQRLASIVLTQLQGVGNATWAGLVELHAQGQADVFRQRLLELTSMVSGLSFCLLAPIAAYNHHFVSRWVGTANFASEAVSLISCLNVWLWAVFSLWGWPISGTGNIGYWAPYAVANIVINFAVSLIATWALGMVGPLLGTLTAFLVIQSWGMARVLKRLFALSPWELWRCALSPLGWGSAYGVLLWWWAREHVPLGWVGLLLEMALAGLGGFTLWWLMGLRVELRRAWLAHLRLAVRR